MDFGKIEPVLGGSNTIATKLGLATQRYFDFAKYSRYFRSSSFFGSLLAYFRFQ